MEEGGCNDVKPLEDLFGHKDDEGSRSEPSLYMPSGNK
jgi:hypothetical protein